MEQPRYVAFSTITGNWLAASASAADARDRAVIENAMPDNRYVEVLDCGDRALEVIGRCGKLSLFLHQAQAKHPTVFRGDGWEHLAPVALAGEGTPAPPSDASPSP